MVRMANPKSLKCAWEKNYNIKIYTRFGKNTAECDNKHILLTEIGIFSSEFGLTPRYFALHLIYFFWKHCSSLDPIYIIFYLLHVRI